MTKVRWEIEVDAKDAEGAALQAYELMRAHGSTATVFQVQLRSHGQWYTVDLIDTLDMEDVGTVDQMEEGPKKAQLIGRLLARREVEAVALPEAPGITILSHRRADPSEYLPNEGAINDAVEDESQ